MCLTKKVLHWVMYYDWIHLGTKTDIIFLEQDLAPSHISQIRLQCIEAVGRQIWDQYKQELSDGWSFAKVG